MLPTQNVLTLRNTLGVVAAICITLSLIAWGAFLLFETYSVGIIFKYFGIVLVIISLISIAAWLVVVLIFFSRFRLSFLVYTSIAIGGVDWLLTSKVRFFRDAGILAAVALFIFVLLKLLVSGDARYASLREQVRSNSLDVLSPDLKNEKTDLNVKDQGKLPGSSCALNTDDRPDDF